MLLFSLSPQEKSEGARRNERKKGGRRVGEGERERSLDAILENGVDVCGG